MSNPDLRGTREMAAPGTPAQATPFILVSERDAIVAFGVARLFDGPADRLPETTRAYLDSLDATSTSSLLVGAVPFDHQGRAYLVHPTTVARFAGITEIESLVAKHRTTSSLAGIRWAVIADPDAAQYESAVRRALALMQAQPDAEADLRKVVLARSLVLTADRPIDPVAVLERLYGDPRATTFLAPLPSAEGPTRALVGATPELLLAKTRSVIRSMPLAGSARRGSDPATDRDALKQLLASEKDRREHAAVVEWIADHLSPYCITLSVPDPEPWSTQTLWHLGTRIHGQLRDSDISSIELTLALHPTPAVCGLPFDRATSTISDLEPFERGFFAGAVGWCNAHGDGQWYVSIRCAEISGQVARLYAGAGIVVGSDPEAETRETSAKFMALLRALGVDEQGKPQTMHRA